MPPGSMLPEEDPLPGPERKPTATDRHRQARMRQDTSDMSRHVVRALGRVDETRITIGREVTHERLHIAENIRVGIFAEHQRCAGVNAEQMTQADMRASRRHGERDLRGDLVGAPAPSLYNKLCLIHQNHDPRTICKTKARPAQVPA